MGNSFNIMLVTGCSGLIGSEVVSYFSSIGWRVYGIDNNMRAEFFGPAGDTRWNLFRLQRTCKGFTHHEIDIRQRLGIAELMKSIRPHVVVHTAAQPSHDLAASMPFEDFEINALGTLNLLENYRLVRPDGIFVHMSTNKVYGDAPNEIPMKELNTRWEYADPPYQKGIPENFSIDASKHSLFGASKLAADIYVQEYGRYHGLRTVCFRAGCLTGANHSAVELHGFLNYLIKSNLEGKTYRVYGYKGKQVRDNLHAQDVVRAIHQFIEKPTCGAVYNIGGGRANSCSILEAFALVEQVTGRKQNWEYIDKPRQGDHICYISDLTKSREQLNPWTPRVSLPEIIEEIVRAWESRATVESGPLRA